MPRPIPWKSVPWAKLALAAQWLFTRGKALLKRNLTAAQRRELADLLGTSKGRRSNLTPRQRERFAALVKQAFVGPPKRRS